MKNRNSVLMVFKQVGLVLALVLSMSAGASLFNRTESWTEDALLYDGRSLEVKREVEFVMRTSGELAGMFHSSPTTYWLKFKHPNTGKTIKWQGEPHFKPIMLDFVNGVPYLVVFGKPDQSNMKKYGCPDIPYVFLRYDEKTENWAPLQQGQIPKELKNANLAPSYDGTYTPTDNYHPSRHLVETMIWSMGNATGGLFQSNIPVNFDSWHYQGKLRYRNERDRNDCRPARQRPPEIALPPAQKIALEILESKDYTPELIINSDNWARLAFDRKEYTDCMTLLKPANPNDPLMNGRYIFVKDKTGHNVMQFKPFAAPGLNTICDANNMWFTDYVGEDGMLILAKYSINGDMLYRIGFERPEAPKGFLGGIMYPTFKSADGYLYFEWWNSNGTTWERHVKQSLRVRLREPESIASINIIR